MLRVLVNQLRNPRVMQGCGRIEPLGRAGKGNKRKTTRWIEGQRRDGVGMLWRDRYSVAALVRVRC